MFSQKLGTLRSENFADKYVYQILALKNARKLSVRNEINLYFNRIPHKMIRISKTDCENFSNVGSKPW